MNPSEMDEEESDEEVEQSPINENASGIEQPLRCRSVRIGSFKVYPLSSIETMNVYLASEAITFNAPVISDNKKIATITLKPSEISQMLLHFGKRLPLFYVVTTSSFAEAIRKSLNMTEIEHGYYDPNSNDEKVKRITFLIDSINEEQQEFLRHNFLTDGKVTELDQETANEILVTSTPSRKNLRRYFERRWILKEIGQKEALDVTCVCEIYSTRFSKKGVSF